MLSVKNLFVAYGKRVVLRDAALDVGVGEVVVLLGRNGSGKSTLLKAVAGLVTPRTGSIKIDGRDVVSWPVYRRASIGMSMLLQTDAIFPSLTIRQNLLLSSPKKAPEDSLSHPLFSVLEERLSVRAGLLSGGQQRLLAIAMILSQRPRLLLFDEPAAGLAPDLAPQLFSLLATLARQLHSSILMAEQHEELSTTVADRVFHMKSGVPVLWRPGAGPEQDCTPCVTVNDQSLPGTPIS